MVLLNLLYTHTIILVIFFIVYSILFTINKNNFRGANNYLDIFYMTTSAQSSLGYANVVPNSNITKFVASVHNIVIIFILAHFLFKLIKSRN